MSLPPAYSQHALARFTLPKPALLRIPAGVHDAAFSDDIPIPSYRDATQANDSDCERFGAPSPPPYYRDSPQDDQPDVEAQYAAAVDARGRRGQLAGFIVVVLGGVALFLLVLVVIPTVVAETI